MHFKVIPIPESLKSHVECIRVGEYNGAGNLAINVCLNGLPGIVFQHHEGCSPVDHIATSAGRAADVPVLFVYGQMTLPGVMHHKCGTFTTTQIVLKPHALNTLLGVNAAELTNSVVDLREFAAADLSERLLDTEGQPGQSDLLLNFLIRRLERAQSSDALVRESLHLIDANTGAVSVSHLLEKLNISERQFEKRFSQTVGLSPQFYIRVRRFNEALRRMRRFETLTDLAHSLNFYDQSHFIRDIKAFSGITPKNLAQKLNDFDPAQPVYAYT